MVGVASSIPSGGNFIFADFETPWCQFCTKMPEMSDLCYLGKTRIMEQESPPVWMQEDCQLHSKCSLCCSVSWWWGYPHSVLTGRYPQPVPMGWVEDNPSSADGGGYSHPAPGVPFHQPAGVPPPHQPDGVPPEMWADRHLWAQYFPHCFGMR